MKTGARPRRRRGAGQARKPRTPLRKRIGRRLPSRGRVLALLLMSTLLVGLVTLINGPWLRVDRVAHAGERFTDVDELAELLGSYRGDALLTLDSAGLAGRLRALPAVADATVQATLPGELRVTLTEKQPAFTWLTSAVRLVVAADGTIIGELSRDAEPSAELAGLPSIDDQRRASRRLTVGDRLPAGEVRMGLRLLQLEPALIGSSATHLAVRMHDEYGFIIASRAPVWRAALGFYGLDPREEASVADERLEAQVAAIRTLFATRPESSVTWLDARNPGKVYWAP